VTRESHSEETEGMQGTEHFSKIHFCLKGSADNMVLCQKSMGNNKQKEENEKGSERKNLNLRRKTRNLGSERETFSKIISKKKEKGFQIFNN
jgi:hypothetical protein